MCDKKHNGWSSYETWAYALWMDNDEASYNYWRKTADGLAKHSIDHEDATYKLMETIKEECDQNTPEVSGVFADLLGAAIGEINWHEIAKHLMDESYAELAAEAKA
jgi:hypothetical protein